MQGGDLLTAREKGKIAAGLKAAIVRAGKALGRALYPEDITCDVCGAELPAETRYSLCAACTAKLPLIKGHRCLNCGVPINDEADYCLRCQRTESVFRRNIAPLRYDGEGKQLVHMFKFGGKKYLAHLLGAMMADEFITSGEAGEIIVPVPMSESEESRRGFNQSALLAADIGERLGIPVLPALVKAKDTPAQKGLTGKERAENLRGCFSARFADHIRGRRILLVDDVFTTGSTANECARTLLKAKVRSVTVLTAAVTVPENKVEVSAPAERD